MSAVEWNKKRILLFDLDGTLTDPGIGITNSVMYALKKFGIAVDDRSELYKFIGPPLTESFQNYYGFDEEQAKDAVEAYREYYRDKGIFENRVYTGIPEVLKALKTQGKIVCLATSKPEIFANRILEHFDLTRYFDVIAGSLLDGGRVKKSDVIRHALHLLNTEMGIKMPEREAGMIGDREHDVFGAAENDLPTLGVLFGYGSRKELTDAGASAIVATISDLYKILTGEETGR